MVYPSGYIHNVMDVDDYMICCGVEREEIYMGGGLWVYKCPKCDSEIEWRKK